MSDERLRELERRWRASGALEDEAAWLGERVRLGDLERARVQVAGLLGHAAARAVWLAEGDLLLPGAEAAALTGTSANRLAAWRKRGLPSHRRGRRVLYDPTELLAFLESRPDNASAWTIRPLGLLGNWIEVRDHPAALRALRAALESADPTPQEWWDLGPRLRLAATQLELPAAERDAGALADARDGLAYGRGELEQRFANGLRTLIDGIRYGPSPKPKIGEALEGLPPCSSEERILSAIRAALLPWVLESSK